MSRDVVVLVLTDEQMDTARTIMAQHHTFTCRWEDTDPSSHATHRKVGDRRLYVFTTEWVNIGILQPSGNLLRHRGEAAEYRAP